MTITVYQKPTCTTCRQVHAALRDAGVDFEAVDYYTDPIPKAKLKELLRKMKMSARDLLRTREDIYKKLRLGERDLSDDEIVDLMVKHPDLIERPIVEKGARAILAPNPREHRPRPTRSKPCGRVSLAMRPAPPRQTTPFRRAAGVRPRTQRREPPRPGLGA